MYPSFKSIGEREQKRKALLERINRDLAIDKIKRQAYSEAIWPGDAEKNRIGGFKSGSTTIGIQTGESQLPERTITARPSAPTSSGASSSIFEWDLNPSSRTPSVLDSSTTATTASSSSPSVSTETPVLSGSSESVKTVGEIINDIIDGMDIGNEEESMSDIDENEDPIPNIEDAQREAFMRIKTLYEENPEFGAHRIRPMRLDGKGLQNGYLMGLKDHKFTFFKRDSVKPLRNSKFEVLIDEVDWMATENLIAVKSDLKLQEIRNKATHKATMKEINKTINEQGMMANEDPMDPLSKAVGDDRERESEPEILRLFKKRAEDMKTLEGMIHPVGLKGKSVEIYSEYHLVPNFEAKKVRIFKILENPRMYNHVNWTATLEYIIERGKDIGIDIENEDMATLLNHVSESKKRVLLRARKRDGTVRRFELLKILILKS